MIRHPLPLKACLGADSVRGFGADAGGEEPSFPWGAQLRAGKDEQTGPPTCLRQHRGWIQLTPRSTGPTGSEDSDQPIMPDSG